MEKGSFHPSALATTALSRVQETDELVRGIALPNQLPKSMDFSEIPPSAMKSSTLESLISQNEDLMARLSVTLRKHNRLEERNAVLERENATFSSKFEAVREQLIVLQEKDRISTERGHRLIEENASFKNQARKLERLYADLFVQAQAFQRRLVHLERYRARIHKAAPGVQLRAKGFALAQEELAASKKTQTISLMQTVNSYEAKLAEVKSELDVLRLKAGDRDQIFEEKMKLDNQLVYEQRQFQIRHEEAQKELDQLADVKASLRLELKENILLVESQRTSLTALNQELPDLRQEQQAMREQIESLQALWSHKQKELEQNEEKNRSLQKLNQSLSATLNQQRKEIGTIKNDMEREQFSAQEKIKALIAEVQMLRRQIMENRD